MVRLGSGVGAHTGQKLWSLNLGDDKLGPPAILISQDGASWIELVVGHGPVIETPAGIVITQFDEEGDLADEIVVYNGESSSTVQADWPAGDWPGFLGGIGNALILIDGTDVWVGEVFEELITPTPLTTSPTDCSSRRVS